MFQSSCPLLPDVWYFFVRSVVFSAALLTLGSGGVSKPLVFPGRSCRSPEATKCLALWKTNPIVCSTLIQKQEKAEKPVIGRQRGKLGHSNLIGYSAPHHNCKKCSFKL